MNQTAVIIGAGLGGLVCGDILARNGYDVCVLEQGHKIGGCIQSFSRGKTVFDTGMHYIGGIEEGQALYPYFRYLNLLDLPWKKLDEDCADDILIGGEHFLLPQGYDAFYTQLSERFPEEKTGLKTYLDTLRKIGEMPMAQFQGENSTMLLFEQNAYEWLNSLFSNPLLVKVLSGAYLRLGLDKAHLPLFSYAEIQNSYIQSAYRLQGGGDQLAAKLAKSITANGGRILCNSAVTEITVTEGHATGVVVNGMQHIPADYVISAIHPRLTVELIPSSAGLRPVYRKRMLQLQNTPGIFTANIRLKDNGLKYCNHMIYVHDEDDDAWEPSYESVRHILIHFYPDGKAVDLLTAVPWEKVSGWAELPPGKRGNGYAQFKAGMLEQCLSLAERAVPEIRAAADTYSCSTPLTYKSYLEAPEGTSFGIRKDCNSAITTVLSPQTPIRNLLLTGQNMHLHGVMGTTIAAFTTAAELLGRDTIYKLLTENQ